MRRWVILPGPSLVFLFIPISTPGGASWTKDKQDVGSGLKPRPRPFSGKRQAAQEPATTASPPTGKFVNRYALAHFFLASL